MNTLKPNPVIVSGDNLAEAFAPILARKQDNENVRVSLFANASLRRVLLHVAVASGAWLLYLAVVRETPGFWTNAGGYPIWLRETASCYYPMLFGQGALMVFVASSMLLGPSQSVREWWAEAALLALVGFLVLASGVVTIADNLTDYIDGNPPGYHHQHIPAFKPEESSAIQPLEIMGWAKYAVAELGSSPNIPGPKSYCQDRGIDDPEQPLTPALSPPAATARHRGESEGERDQPRQLWV